MYKSEIWMFKCQWKQIVVLKNILFFDVGDKAK